MVAGGMESMTNAPHLLPGLRKGVKYGGAGILDSTAYDGLTDAFDQIAMGESTERHNARLGLTREEQDAFSARSHQRAAEATEKGLFDDEIVPVALPRRRGSRSCSRPTRASEGTPRRRPWRSCGRRSPRTARSRPGPPRRSPTAPSPWS